MRLGLAAALTALVAGCSAVGSSSVTSSPPSATPSATPTLSGQQLAGVLLPASSMPKGYKAGSATQNTGSQPPSDTAQPMPPSQVCEAFTESSFIRAAGIATGDWAQSDYISTDQTHEVLQEIDTFTGTDAQKAMAKLWQEFGQCSSFSDQVNGTTAPSTLTRSRLPGEGDEAIKAVIVSPVIEGGKTLVAIRTGSQVITMLDSSSGNDLGSAGVDYAEQILRRLGAAG
jgi:hypothetical protein